MKKMIIAGLIAVSLLQIGCSNKKIDRDSVIEACKTAIDSTYSFDPVTSDGDTLYLGFPEELNLEDNDKYIIQEYVKDKYKLKVCLSSLKDLLINENISFEHPNLKNFYISISRIYYKSRKTIVVESYKYKGMFAAVNVETVFEYTEGRWICTGSRITCMS